MSNNSNDNNNVSDSISKNNKDNKVDDAKRKLAEVTMKYRLLDVLMDHLQTVFDDLDNNKSSLSSFKLEPAERKILYQVNNFGVVEGLVAGVLTLTFLRQSRSYFQRTVRQRAHQQRQQQQQQQQQMFTSSRSPFQQHQHQQQYPPPPSFGQGGGGPGAGFPPPVPPVSLNRRNAAASSLGHRIPTMIGWLIDCMAAFTMTVAVSVRFTDMDKIFNKVAELPLVEGHSVVAREFCPPILQEVHKQMQMQLQKSSSTSTPSYKPPLSSQPAPAFGLSSSSSSNAGSSSSSSSSDEQDMNGYSPRHLLQNPQTAQLGAVVKFAENCKHRQMMEQSWRREQGVALSFPVEIPTTGVPRDLEVDLFSSDGEEHENGNDQESHQDFYDPNSGSDDDDDNDRTSDAWSDGSEQRR